MSTMLEKKFLAHHFVHLIFPELRGKDLHLPSSLGIVLRSWLHHIWQKLDFSVDDNNALSQIYEFN